jgi:hypothetical protein
VDFEDTSNYSYTEVREEISFEFDVKASAYDDAYEKAERLVLDLSFDSTDGYVWEIEDAQITDAVRTSPEPTLAEALAIVRDWLAVAGSEHDEVQEAFGIVLDAVEKLITPPDEPTAY